MVKDSGQENGCNIRTDKAFIVFGEAGVSPAVLVQRHVEEPPMQEVLMDLSHQLTIPPKGVQDHRQLGFQ
jgi:hypothetical protein